MRAFFVFLALVALAVALPQRQGNRPGGNRPGNNRPRPNNPPSNTRPADAPPPANTALPDNGNNNGNNSNGNNGNNNGGDGTIASSLVPDFGVTPGIPSTTQAGSCQGNNNVNIPCQCPPSKAAFISTLEQFNAQGNIFDIPFNFDTNVADQSPATQLARISAMTIALQNFDQTVKGEGCPAGAAAPNLARLQSQLQQQV